MNLSINSIGEATMPGLKRLKEVAGSFEAIFIYMLIQQMRKSVMRSGLFYGKNAEEIFTQFFDWEVAQRLSHKGDGLGIAKKIVEKYKKLVFPAGERHRGHVFKQKDVNTTSLKTGISAGLSGASPAGKNFEVA
jgi:Rod binding domain-containing protein